MQIKKDFKWLILIFFVTVLLLFKLFYNVRLYGHDTIFHTSSIIYLSRTISFHNIFGSNIISNDLYRFGYGTWLFYPKLPHLLAAYIYIIAKNVYLSMNIVYFIVTFLSGICMFYLAKKMFNSNKVAFLSSIIYLSYSYHICEVYIRDAFAENFMFLVIPLVFLGLYELKDNNKNKFYLFFILGYIIGMYSHLVSMVFCTIFIALFILYYRKDFFKLEKIKALIISSVIVTCISLPFLTFVLEHKFMGDYTVFTASFSNKVSTMSNVLNIDKYFNHNKNAIHACILVYINYSVILLLLLTAIKYLIKGNRVLYKEERKLLFFGLLICIALINSHWLWDHLPEFFSMIQFPWRIMTFFSVIISLYASLFFYSNFKFINKFVINSLYVVFTLAVVIEGVNNIYYFGKTKYSYEDMVTSKNFMGWQREYLPFITNYYLFLLDHFSLDIDNLEYKVTVLNKNVSLDVIKDDFPDLEFKVDNVDKDVIVILPRTYYFGYKLYDENNNYYKLYQSDSGFIEVNLKRNGTYNLIYSGTLYDKIAKIICTITVIFIFMYGGIYLWRKRK